jgi:hypothetical protein
MVLKAPAGQVARCPRVLVLGGRDAALAGLLRAPCGTPFRVASAVNFDTMNSEPLASVFVGVSVKMFVVSRSYTLPSTPVQVTEPRGVEPYV